MLAHENLATLSNLVIEAEIAQSKEVALRGTFLVQIVRQQGVLFHNRWAVVVHVSQGEKAKRIAFVGHRFDEIPRLLIVWITESE